MRYQKGHNWIREAVKAKLYPVKNEHRVEAMEQLGRDMKSDDRKLAHSAIRILVDMDKVNLERQKFAFQLYALQVLDEEGKVFGDGDGNDSGQAEEDEP